jgi:hypothetical protein
VSTDEYQRARAQTHARTHAHRHTQTQRKHVHTHKHTDTDTDTDTHTHAHTHTRTDALSCARTLSGTLSGRGAATPPRNERRESLHLASVDEDAREADGRERHTLAPHLRVRHGGCTRGARGPGLADREREIAERTRHAAHGDRNKQTDVIKTNKATLVGYKNKRKRR